MQGSVARDYEGGVGSREIAGGAGAVEGDDGEMLRPNGQGGPGLERRRVLQVPVRAPDTAVRRRRNHGGRRRRHAGEDRRLQLRRFPSCALPKRRRYPTFVRPQGEPQLSR